MDSIFCINTKEKTKFEIKKEVGERVFDFQSLKDSRILLLTEDGHLILQRIDGESQTSATLSTCKVQMENIPGICTQKIAVYPEEGLVAVCVDVYTKLSRVVLFKIKNNKLILKSTLDFRNLSLNYFEAFKFNQKKCRQLIISGISNYGNSMLYTFIIDKRNYKLLKLKEKVTGVHHPSELHQVDKNLLGVDEKGALFEISV